MASPSMNVVIHDAVRRDLARFVAALTSYDDDRDRARGLWRAWENFQDQLAHHHESEHVIVWPALSALGVEASLLAQLDAEHDRMARALDRTHVAMEVFADRAERTHAQKALKELRALAKTIAQHFSHEEAELEPVFAEHAGSAPLRTMAKRMAQQPLPRLGRFFAWLGDSEDPEERAAVSRDVPAPVVAVIGGVFGFGYRRTVAPVWKA